MIAPTTTLCPLLQIKASGADWDRYVASAFASLDTDDDGVITAQALEQLLCGEDGCEVRLQALRRPDVGHVGVKGTGREG